MFLLGKTYRGACRCLGLVADMAVHMLGLPRCLVRGQVWGSVEQSLSLQPSIQSTLQGFLQTPINPQTPGAGGVSLQDYAPS